MKINKSSFYPKSLEGKSNYKIYYTIEKDGTVKESVLLSILDSKHREEIILMHYMQNQQVVFGSGTLGINILSRDNPRDFEIETSNQDHFNVEITSISNHEDTFRKLSNEERHTKIFYQRYITLRELKKVKSKFSHMGDLDIEISKLEKNNNIGLDDQVENPLYNKNCGTIYISDYKHKLMPLSDILKKSISTKVNKKHKDKEDTILVIDNRTTKYEVEDVNTAITDIKDYLSAVPFKEIWFYTGFCCDMDGTNADFCMIPLKISSDMESKLIEYLNSVNQ